MRQWGGWIRTAAWGAFALTLYVGSLPLPTDSVERLWQLALLGSWLPIGIAIIGRRAIQFWIQRHYAIPPTKRPPRQAHAARLFLIGAVLLLLKVPLIARFWISYPFLEHYAYQQHQVVPYPDVDTRNRWLGLYRTSRISVGPNGVTIGLIDGGSLRYDLREHFSESNPSFRRLGGNWYMGRW